MSVNDAQLDAPDEILVRRRWIKVGNVEWAENAHRIMLEHGVVFGTAAWPKRDHARWRARKLIAVLTELGLCERWEVVEHVNRRGDGWVWSVEYIGGSNG